MKTKLYYCETTGERVIIQKVFSNGLVNVTNKAKFNYQILIGELKKIY